MKFATVLNFFAFLIIFNSLIPSNSGSYWNDIKVTGTGGGVDCAACTIITSLIQQLSVIHDKPVEDVVAELCDYFTPEFKQICVYLVDTYGQDVIELLNKDFNPDEVCHGIELCTDPTCLMYPNPSKKVVNVPVLHHKRKNVGVNPWDWIVELLDRIVDHKPILDIDDDVYSFEPTLRGSNWRGKDCDDFDYTIYPGRIPDTDIEIDANCNGIYGANASIQSYESLFCKGSGQLGLIVVGDSAGAHFSIPEAYMNASEIDKYTYQDLFYVLSDEFDWPQRSGFTATADVPNVLTNSIYKKLAQRNRCNHRDYQNVGVNGCRSGAMANEVIKAIQRNQTTDQPVLLFF